MPQILSVAGLLKASIEGWTFQLSPRSWRTDQHTPTIMIFKYCARSLEEMAKNAAAWGWPQAAQNAAGELQPTQRMIQQIFTSAASAAPGTPYARFYHDVVRNPAWNGILLLNAPVAIAEFPQALQFLTAGVDTSRFYAHHVGFAVTPFNVSPTITLGQTAVFGLIDYQDPQDLTLSATTPFAFKTLALTARFANAALADFSAQVELMVNCLFGVELTKIDPQRGNNLVLNGSYQRQNDAPSYAFTLQGTHVYMAARSALASIEVLGAQLQTATATGSASSVVVDFVLSGNLRFVEFEHFDLFSYGQESAAPPGKQPADGYLRYGNLVVRMSFPLATTTQQTFSVTEDRLSFDLANSQARPRALAANFPLRLSGLISSPNLAPPGDPPEGQRPEDLGYTSIAAPIDQSLLSPPWYGLIFSLDLGSHRASPTMIDQSISRCNCRMRRHWASAGRSRAFCGSASAASSSRPTTTSRADAPTCCGCGGSRFRSWAGVFHPATPMYFCSAIPVAMARLRSAGTRPTMPVSSRSRNPQHGGCCRSRVVLPRGDCNPGGVCLPKSSTRRRS
jgi:hypothetical protein